LKQRAERDSGVLAEPPHADAEEVTGRRRKTGSVLGNTFASLAYRDFVYLWLGQITHAGALWMDMVARPLLVLSVTGSPVHLGLVIAVRSIPAFGLGLVAGVVADNFNRRTVLLITKAIVLALATVFAILLLLGQIELWHIYLFTFLRGVSQAFDQPARRAMVPSIVPKHLVTNALALSSGSVQLMRIFGAGGAGLIIAFGGIEAAFVAVAVIYAGAVFFTWRLRPPDHARTGYQGIRSALDDLVQGFRFAWQSPTIRGIVIVAAGYFTFGMAFMYVFAPLLAKRVLEIGDSGFGYMMGAMGIGGVIGNLALAALTPQRRRGQILAGALATLGLLFVAVSLVTYLGSVVIAFVMIAFLGLGQSWLLPLINATLLESTPENMRGRMLGLLSLDRATATLGGAIAGFLAAAVGPQAAQIVFGGACIVTAGMLIVFYPAIRRIE
jgi:predicted MFS family arabinose efflux permease